MTSGRAEDGGKGGGSCSSVRAKKGDAAQADALAAERTVQVEQGRPGRPPDTEDCFLFAPRLFLAMCHVAWEQCMHYAARHRVSPHAPARRADMRRIPRTGVLTSQGRRTHQSGSVSSRGKKCEKEKSASPTPPRSAAFTSATAGSLSCASDAATPDG